MRYLHWKLLVAVFVLALNSAAIGEEDAPDVDDVLGNVDDKVIGIWEHTDEDGDRYLMYLRPDGIAIFNSYEEGLTPRCMCVDTEYPVDTWLWGSPLILLRRGRMGRGRY